MIKKQIVIIRLSAIFKRCILYFILCFISLTISANEQLVKSNEAIQTLTAQCLSDTCKFNLLVTAFAQNIAANRELALEFAQKAIAIAKNNQNPEILSKAFFMQAEISKDSGNIEQVISNYKRSVFYAQQANNLSAEIKSCVYQANYLHDQNQTQEALIVLDSVFYVYVKRKPKIADPLLDEICWIYQCNAMYEEEILALEKYLKYFKENQLSGMEVRTLIKMARSYNNQNKPKLSLEAYLKAISIGEIQINKSGLKRLYFEFADFFSQKKKNIELALTYFNLSLHENPTTELEIRENILGFSRIGNMYIELNQDSLGIEWYKKSFETLKQHNLTNPNIVREYGAAFYKMAQYDSAAYYLNYCAENYDDNYVAYIRVLGHSYFLLKQYDKSYEFYQKALNSAVQLGIHNEIAATHIKLAEYEIHFQNLQKAEYHLKKALKNANASNDLVILHESHQANHKYYMLLKQFELAYRHLDTCYILNDSLITLDKQFNTAFLETKPALDELREQNAVAKNQILQKKKNNRLLFALSLLLFSSGLIILILYRKKKFDNHKLEENKIILENKNNEIAQQVEEIKSQRDEIEEQSDEIKRVSEILHETDQMKLRFFSNISHEIRTPLTLILNPLENILQNQNQDSETRHQLEVVHKNAKRLHELTNQILDLQKLDTGNLKLNPQNNELVELIKFLISSFESFAQKRNCKIYLTTEFEQLICYFDTDKISKILSNLLSNAIKYNKENGRIDIKLEAENDQLTIHVRDEGIGIPSDQSDKIFRRYYQLSNPDSNYEGTGIGLAYVHELMLLMQGEISVDSKVNQGTRISLKIPVKITRKVSLNQSKSVKNIEAIDEGSKSTSEHQPFYINPDTEIILIVEDNDDMREYISRMFIPNYQICFAKNGKEGVEQAYEILPDIIISDIMMPVMSGIEMCTELKSNIRTCHIPILFLTAKDGAENEIEGYQSGVDDYLIKPFNQKVLTKKIENILQTRKASRARFQPSNNEQMKLEGLQDLDKEFISRCNNLIEQNMGNKLYSIQQLADDLNFSRRNLFRKIKTMTNCTPSDYIRTIRLNYAAKLILQSDLLIYEVAEQVSFESATKFSKAFKNQFNCLPSDYKEFCNKNKS